MKYILIISALLFSACGKDKRKNREKKILKNCGCCCYCECRNPLNDGFCLTLNKSEYEYTCSDCGGKSVFNFDIAPVPIRISYEPKESE